MLTIIWDLVYALNMGGDGIERAVEIIFGDFMLEMWFSQTTKHLLIDYVHILTR